MPTYRAYSGLSTDRSRELLGPYPYARPLLVLASDMVGNVFEWVADWSELATAQNDWPAGPYGADFSAIGGAGSVRPSALTRGCEWFGGLNAGVFEISGGNVPSSSYPNFGFRCGR